MRCLSISIFCIFIATASFAQVFQTHYESLTNENHYTVAYPDDWNGDYFVIGTRDMTGVPPLKKAFMKRIDADGTIVWEQLMPTPGYHNTAFHVDESYWGGGSVTVAGFESIGPSQRAIIYGVQDDGTILNPLLLEANVDNLTSNSMFMHLISTDPSGPSPTGDPLEDGSGWIAVGSQHPNFDIDKNGLVVRYTASGTLAWARHIATPNDNNPNIDFDAINHVVEVPDVGFFLSGSGNFEDGTYRQGALAMMLNYQGEVKWRKVYSHSPDAFSTVAASATYTDDGELYQITNGQGDSSFLENGFSIHRFNPITGDLVADHSNHFHLDPTAMKAMTVRNHKTNPTVLMVSGFIEIPNCENDIACGLVAGDHPPFLMQINQEVEDDTIPLVDWHHIYDVPSTSYGASGDYFDVFSNINQPYIYHPEMMLPLSDTSGYLIAGLHTHPIGPGDYDLELILTDQAGFTQCPTFQTEILTMPAEPIIQMIGSVEHAYYHLTPFFPQTQVWQSNPIPCDECEIPELTYQYSCDSLFLNITLLSGDPSNLCFEVNYGDGSPVESYNGEQFIVHAWENGFTGGEICVTSWCCDDLSGTPETQCFTVTLPDDCDCPHCTPFLKACQINLESPIEPYGASPFDDEDDDEYPFSVIDIFTSIMECPYGCDEAPYEVKLSLGNLVFNTLFSNCLNNVSVKWYVDGTLVGETPCYNYQSITIELDDPGTYSIVANLTNCDDEICIDEIFSSITVGDCIVPPNPKIHIDELINDDDCPYPKCRVGFCPEQPTCSTMISAWYVDGAYYASGSFCIELCLNWGFHTIELRYTCTTTGETSSAIEYIYCGPPYVIGPVLIDIAPDWLPQYFPMSAEIDTDCNLKIDFGNMDTEVTGTFSPFQSIGESTFEGFLDGIDPSEKFFSWRISAIEENGNENIIVEHNSFSNTPLTSFTNDLITVKDTFDQLISLKFELTGPDWLVSQTNPGTLSYEIPVSDCPPTVICASDIDGDSYVNINDLLALLSDFGTACE